MGNHEYDLDRTNLEKKVKDGRFPLLTTNVYDSIIDFSLSILPSFIVYLIKLISGYLIHLLMTIL
jgi:2',3'-cyclic-nucleotide 2'-phosphodiesterase (5'-nucleotidase family)